MSNDHQALFLLPPESLSVLPLFPLVRGCLSPHPTRCGSWQLFLPTLSAFSFSLESTPAYPPVILLGNKFAWFFPHQKSPQRLLCNKGESLSCPEAKSSLWSGPATLSLLSYCLHQPSQPQDCLGLWKTPRVSLPRPFPLWGMPCFPLMSCDFKASCRLTHMRPPPPPASMDTECLGHTSGPELTLVLRSSHVSVSLHRRRKKGSV